MSADELEHPWILFVQKEKPVHEGFAEEDICVHKYYLLLHEVEAYLGWGVSVVEELEVAFGVESAQLLEPLATLGLSLIA